MRRLFRVTARCSLLLVFATALTSSQQLSPPPSQHQVAILRQINHVNDDGSYTYGYEAADGSFKIETRDVLGTVRGMFGFVDESGRQRRVSYTAGNTTGFQTTRQPGTEDGGPEDAGVTSTPVRIYHPTAPPQLILRPVRPFVPGAGAGRDSVSKLIQHLGVIKTKQSEPGRVDTTEETPRTTTSPKSTTAASETSRKDSGKGDEVTTRRPTVVQRILRTRPRTNVSSRKEESLPVNLRAPLVTPLGQVESSTKKREEEEKKEGVSSSVDGRQRQPLVALKVSENGGVPRFVVLPSRILRWRPSSEIDQRKGQEERIGYHPESVQRPTYLGIPSQRDNLQYHFRQLSREQLVESQPPLQIFTQKSLPSTNYQDQQFLPQKNVYAFVTTTPRPRLIQPRPLNPVSTHSSLRVAPEDIPAMYQQIYEPTGPPHDANRLLFQTGNYADKIQQQQAYPQQQQMVYQQKPILYNTEPRRYDPYYPRPNAFVPNPQIYPYYGRQDLLELLLSYLQIQPKSLQPPNTYSNPLPYDANISFLPRQEYPQTGARYQQPAFIVPYPPQYDQYQDAYRPAPIGTNNLDVRRFLGLRELFRPAIRQQLEVPSPLPRPILYGNGYNVPYIKNKGNMYPEDLYADPRGGRINSQQGISLRPTPLQFQPLFLESAPRTPLTHQQQDFSILPTGPDNSQTKFPALDVTTVAPGTTTSVPQENQGLPYGFTKKFRSVQIIPPEANDSSEKESKSDS